LERWVVTEPSPDLLQRIPRGRERCESLRDRVFGVDLRCQHPPGDAVANSETTTSHKGAHPETGMPLNGCVRGTGLVQGLA